MTNEEAIRIIKIVLAIAEDFEITVQGEEFTEEKCKEAVEIVIKSLERQEKILSYIDRLLNQGTGKKKSLEFLKKYILEGEKNDE